MKRAYLTLLGVASAVALSTTAQAGAFHFHGHRAGRKLGRIPDVHVGQHPSTAGHEPGDVPANHG